MPSDAPHGDVTPSAATPASPSPEPETVWLETLTLAGSDEPVRVVLDERVGDIVYVRHLDPCDTDPQRVPVHPGDQIVMTTPIAGTGVHAIAEVGRVDDLLTWSRVKLDRREAGTVYLRTLRAGDPDDGRRVHVRPGEKVVIEPGAMVLSLDELDDAEPLTESGYRRLAPVLLTWLQIGQPLPPEATRYLLAAARRLDATNDLLVRVEQTRKDLNVDGLLGPVIRRRFYEMVGTVELMTVALGRVIDMAARAQRLIGCTVPLPASVVAKQEAITELRNAYEHIEDRALGKVREKPHQTALTIFDYTRLVTEDRVTYGDYDLELTTELPTLLGDLRRFLKAAAAAADTALAGN